ncbi:P-loop NTPase fold protein [Escherichia coli]|uniref:P-loop NTPase fold protein n=1 Tax=Escherichia coli TaxID=562 RepID=UPI00207B8E90|nr:P-loop NTPase fold protein [Escherichia coli]
MRQLKMYLRIDTVSVISQKIYPVPSLLFLWRLQNVVGIEGAWGSGKTSLLNLILRNLALKKDAHTHVLHISPWLSGGSPVEALFLPVATVIQQEWKYAIPRRASKSSGVNICCHRKLKK